jgi:hypothetical protein
MSFTDINEWVIKAQNNISFTIQFFCQILQKTSWKQTLPFELGNKFLQNSRKLYMTNFFVAFLRLRNFSKSLENVGNIFLF